MCERELRVCLWDDVETLDGASEATHGITWLASALFYFFTTRRVFNIICCFKIGFTF
jgi:hypothetical protein